MKYQNVIGFVGFLIIGFSVAYAIVTAIHSPSYELHRSHSTDECVRVIKHQAGKNSEVLSCETLPEKYNLVWVQ